MDVTEKKISIFSLPVIVAALGYFVDIYDLLLFTIVKKTSMLGVGSTEATLLVDSTRYQLANDRPFIRGYYLGRARR
jgi:hypothetical protein